MWWFVVCHFLYILQVKENVKEFCLLVKGIATHACRQALLKEGFILEKSKTLKGIIDCCACHKYLSN